MKTVKILHLPLNLKAGLGWRPIASTRVGSFENDGLTNAVQQYFREKLEARATQWEPADERVSCTDINIEARTGPQATRET